MDHAPDHDRDADDDRDHLPHDPNPGRHTEQRKPAPWAPYGTLLHLAQLAHREANATSFCDERVAVITAMRTHASLLIAYDVSEPLIHFVRTSTNPWHVLRAHVRLALGQIPRAKTAKQQQAIARAVRVSA